MRLIRMAVVLSLLLLAGGAALAGVTSDGSIFVDEFDGVNLDTNKWVTRLEGTGGIDLTGGGHVRIKSSATDNTACMYTSAIDFGGATEWVYEIKYEVTWTDAGYWRLSNATQETPVLVSYSGTYPWSEGAQRDVALTMNTLITEDYVYDLSWGWWISGGRSALPAIGLNKGQQYTVAMHHKTDGTIDIYLDGSLVANQPSLGAGIPTNLFVGNLAGGLGSTIFIDYIRVGTPVGAIAAPEFSPAGGTYSSPVEVAITCPEAGATIRYTTDGTEPTEDSDVYSSPILVERSRPIKAKAWVGSGVSKVAVANYVITTSAIASDGTIFIDDFDDASLDATKWTTRIEGTGSIDMTGGFARFKSSVPDNTACMWTAPIDFGSVSEWVYEIKYEVTWTDFGYWRLSTAAQETPVLVSYSGAYPWSEGAQRDVALTMNTPISEDYVYALSWGWWISGGRSPVPATGLNKGQQYTVAMYHKTDGTIDIYVDDSLVANQASLGEGIPTNLFVGNVSGSLGSTIFIDYISVGAPVIPTVAVPQFSPAGGTYGTPIEVTISCATEGATIRYTTDGSDPTTSSSVYTSPILVDRTSTVNAKAWLGSDSSATAVGSYIIGTAYNYPRVIPYSDSIVIDGSLSDWAGAEWIDADKHYYASGDWADLDVTSAKFAMKWGANGTKAYIAAKVTDMQPVFSADYGLWDSSDRLEAQIHTTGTATYDPTEESAQQYTVGVASAGIPVTLWSRVGQNSAIPPSADFSCAGAVNGNELIYELALTPFDYFGGLVSQPNVPTTLQAGDVIGLDVVVDSRTNAGQFYMLSENPMGGKYYQTASIGRHLLVMNSTIDGAKKLADGDSVVSAGIVSAVFSDCFYIESSDRSSGIRVGLPNHGRTVGEEVTVSGMIWTLPSGERYIIANYVGLIGVADAVAPLGMNNKSVGGGDTEGQVGIADGAGLNNIGLLVTVWGLATDLGGGRYSIEDGSGASLEVLVAQGTITDGAYVAVTGIVSCEKDESDAIRRLILVQNAATDVTSY